MPGHQQVLEQQSADWKIDDPGASGAIANYRSGVVHLVTAAAEARTLADPDHDGLWVSLVLKTDGGDCTITTASAHDQAGTTTIVLNDAGDIAFLVSVPVGTGYKWRRLAIDGAAMAAMTITTLTSTTVNSTTIANSGNLTNSGNLISGSNTTDRVTVKGIYMTPANVAVAVPTIADAESDEVAVDVSSAFSIQPAVGDAVIAIPAEALPTDCLYNGARVTNTDEITLSFGTKEGGGGVTGANKNFKFLVFDLT